MDLCPVSVLPRSCALLHETVEGFEHWQSSTLLPTVLLQYMRTIVTSASLQVYQLAATCSTCPAAALKLQLTLLFRQEYRGHAVCTTESGGPTHHHTATSVPRMPTTASNKPRAKLSNTWIVSFIGSLSWRQQDQACTATT